MENLEWWSNNGEQGEMEMENREIGEVTVTEEIGEVAMVTQEGGWRDSGYT